MKKKIITRRDFAKRCLVAGSAFSIVPRHVLGGTGYTAPSEQLTKAVIGIGSMGQRHLRYSGAKLLAVCDVDRKHVQKTLGKYGNDVKGYADFREVLAREDIDIVHIATPPHWHGLMSIAAAEAGKDIWCEKPMTRTIGEGRKVVEAVQRNDRIFRLNTWYRFQNENFYGAGASARSIKKLVQSGLLGWPLKVTINGATGFNWKLGTWNGTTNLPPQPVPEELDYDMWLGPAPYRPYNSQRVHRRFRGYWDYDGGGLGDMGQHYLDPVQYILGKDDTSPTFIEADTHVQHPYVVSSWRRIVMRYADGCEIILDGANSDTDAPLIEGPKGKLYRGFTSDIPDLKAKLASLADPEPQITDFAEAVRTRRKFALNEMNAFRSCTLVNLGKIALRLRRPLRFDPVKLEFVGDEQANRLIDQPMRGIWHT